jgi:ATP-dependent Clp protease ATP-binding subunit ClpB
MALVLRSRFFRKLTYYSHVSRSFSSHISSLNSFLSPKDFLVNSPALNALSNSVSEPVQLQSIKLGVQLTKYGVNMTKLAQEGKLETVIGRESEIQQAIQVLSRRRKNNPCLIGEPGVGKTSIVEGLANLISKGLVPESMKDKVIISLDLPSMLAGTKFRGEFEERLKGVMREIEQCGDRIILFIDEIHCLVGAGGSEGAIDASNILKPSLARGYLRCLGTTTIDEYSRYIEKDAALARRFQPVYVVEPSEEQTTKILNGLKSKYEYHHKVIISNDTITNAVKFAGRYYPSKRFPDKAIDLLDEASSRLRNKNESIPSRVHEIDYEIDILQEKINNVMIDSKEILIKDELRLLQLQNEKERITKAWKDQTHIVNLIFETQSIILKLKEEVKNMKHSTEEEKVELYKIVDSIRSHQTTVHDLYKSLQQSSSSANASVSASASSSSSSIGFRNILEVKDIAEVVSIDTGIPMDSMLVKENSNNFSNMENELRSQVIGQDNAIDTIAKCIRLSKAGLRFHDRPIGVFLFLGPTVSFRLAFYFLNSFFCYSLGCW